MNTSVKEAIESPQKAHPRRNGEFTQDDFIKAIQKAFIGVKGRIDARFLWADCGVHRFRVNCWSTTEIQYSEFVYVDEEPGKLTVRREQ